MKTLNRTEVGLILITSSASLISVCYAHHFFSFLYTYVSGEYLKFLTINKIPLFITVVALAIFLATRLYHKKTQSLASQYYNLFEGNPMPMCLVELNTLKFISANKAAIEIYGYSQKEFSSLSVADIRASEETETSVEDLKLLDPGKEKTISRHRKKNGEIILVEITSSIVVFNDKKCLLLLARDLTEIAKERDEKRAAEEEKNREQIFTSYVLQNFPVDVAVFDCDHRYILLNKNAVRNDEMRRWMIGKDDFEYFKLKGKDLAIAEKRREKFLKAINGETQEWIDEHVVDGKLQYVLRTFYPYYENGELKYVYGYGTDITEVKKAQLQRDEYVLQLEKLAFTTSHNLRSPICNLKGLIEILEMKEFETRQIDEVVGCMRTSIEKLDDFTRDLGGKLHDYKQNLAKQQNEQ